MSDPITVPDIPHPTLCWRQNTNVTTPPFLNIMARCTKPKGHDGPHSWELVKEATE